jgi:hypothetical protein
MTLLHYTGSGSHGTEARITTELNVSYTPDAGTHLGVNVAVSHYSRTHNTNSPEQFPRLWTYESKWPAGPVVLEIVIGTWQLLSFSVCSEVISPRTGP